MTFGAEADNSCPKQMTNNILCDLSKASQFVLLQNWIFMEYEEL